MSLLTGRRSLHQIVHVAHEKYLALLYHPRRLRSFPESLPQPADQRVGHSWKLCRWRYVQLQERSAKHCLHDKHIQQIRQSSSIPSGRNLMSPLRLQATPRGRRPKQVALYCCHHSGWSEQEGRMDTILPSGRDFTRRGAG